MTRHIIFPVQAGGGGGGGGGGDATAANQATEISLLTSIRNNQQATLSLMVDYSTGSTYIGEAAIGSLTSAPVWRIFKVETVSGATSIKYSSGLFSQIWDNRIGLTYV